MSLEGYADSNLLLKGKLKPIPSVDTTLTKEGWCAEAKATGEAIERVANSLDGSQNLLGAHLRSKSNPHGVTAEQVGARPDTWMPTIAQVGGVNPNLLDNSYFGNPVDQRGGYVVPPGTPYADLNSFTEVGTTTTYVNINFLYPEENANITVNGVQYVVDKSCVVRGYAGAGHTIDRWKLSANDTLLVNDGSISVNLSNQYAGLVHRFEKKSIPEGVYTLSVLTAQGCYSWTFTASKTSPAQSPVGWYGVADLYSYFMYEADGTSTLYVVDNSVAEKRTVELIAAKLELGTEQTLAHQENGVWVLNEIPNYAEELAKCQRYQLFTELYAAYSAVHIGTDIIDFMIPCPTTMRSTPAIVNAANLRVTDISTNTMYADFTFSVAAVCSNMLRVRASKAGHGLTVAILEVVGPSVGYDANL